MATPTYITSSGGTATTGSTRTPTNPAHQADDIIMVVALYNGAADLTISAGWNTAFAQNNADISTALFWKRATSSAEGNPTVTSSASGTVLYVNSWVVRGCATSGDPFIVTTKTVETDDTINPPNLALPAGADYLVWEFSFIDSNVATASYPNAGYTGRLNTSTATGTTARTAGQEKAGSGGTTHTAGSWTLAASASHREMTLAFRDQVPGSDMQVSASHAMSLVHSASLGAPDTALRATHGIVMSHVAAAAVVYLGQLASQHPMSLGGAASVDLLQPAGTRGRIGLPGSRSRDTVA